MKWTATVRANKICSLFKCSCYHINKAQDEDLKTNKGGTPSEGTPRSTGQGGFNGSLSHLHTCTPKQGMSYHQERGENTTCAPPGKMDVESTGWTRKWRQHQSWDSLAWWHWIVGSYSGKEGTMQVLALLPWQGGSPHSTSPSQGVEPGLSLRRGTANISLSFPTLADQTS